MVDEEEDAADMIDDEEEDGSPPQVAAPAAAPAAPAAPAQSAMPAAQLESPAKVRDDAPVVAGARGQGASALPAVQSEPTPVVKKPSIDPRPLALVQKKDPEQYEWIMDAAKLKNVSPERIAAHLYVESGFNRNVPRGGSGEHGLGQVMPSTATSRGHDGNTFDLNGRLDIKDPRDNVFITTNFIDDLDWRYGKDSVNSVRHFNGSGSKTYDYTFRNGAKKFNFFPGVEPTEELKASWEKQAEGGAATPRGMFDAAKKDGPDGFLRYVVNTAPSGMAMSDTWRHAEGLLVNAMISKGDIEGAQHARDFIFQLSHTGTNMYLMSAHQKLQRGDGVGASQDLAKSHAFFPDGTIGRFRSNGKDVYAERLDENDPSRRLGPPMQITADAVAGMLNQTMDPQKYLKTLTEQQKAASSMRLQETHGKYYEAVISKMGPELALKQGALELGIQRASDANTRSAMGIDAANERALQSQVGQTMRADERNKIMRERTAAMQSKPDMTAEHNYQREANETYNPQMAPGDPDLGRKSTAYINLRRAGITGPQSQILANGLAAGDMRLATDGSQVAVLDKNNKPLQYLPPAVAAQLGGTSVPQQRTAMPTSPVGAMPSPVPSILGAPQR